MENPFCITKMFGSIKCSVCNKILQKEIDLKGEKVFICYSCFSKDFGGYPAFNEKGDCIGVHRYRQTK